VVIRPIGVVPKRLTINGITDDKLRRDEGIVASGEDVVIAEILLPEQRSFNPCPVGLGIMQGDVLCKGGVLNLGGDLGIVDASRSTAR